MKTKKNIEVLLENGIHFNTIMNLSDKQIGVLAEKFFKPMGDVEQAKKDSMKAMRAFVENNKEPLGLGNDPKDFSDEQIFDKVKALAYWAKSPNGSKLNKMAGELYRIAKPLFKRNKRQTSEAVQTTQQTGYKTTAQAGDEVPFGDTLVIAKGPVEIMSKDKPGTGLKKEGEVTEKFESKAQQGLFWAKCNNSKGKTKQKWCKMAKEFSDSTSKKQYKNMPEKKHPEKTVKKTTKKQTDESYERFLEERIYEMIEKHVEPSMTKRDFIKSIQEKKNGSENFMLENPKKNSMFAKDEGLEMKRPIGKLYSKEMKENTTEKERTITKPVIKPKKKNPHRDPNPDVDENPKADQKEKERTITKPGIKPKKKNPHRDPNPDVDENPKAENPKAENQKNQFMSIISTILNNNN